MNKYENLKETVVELEVSLKSDTAHLVGDVVDFPTRFCEMALQGEFCVEERA